MAIVAPAGSTPTPAPGPTAMEDFAKALGEVQSGAPPGLPGAPPDGNGAGKEAAKAGPIAPSQEPDFFPAPGKQKTISTVDAALALQLSMVGGIANPTLTTSGQANPIPTVPTISPVSTDSTSSPALAAVHAINTAATPQGATTKPVAVLGQSRAVAPSIPVPVQGAAGLPPIVAPIVPATDGPAPRPVSSSPLGTGPVVTNADHRQGPTAVTALPESPEGVQIRIESTSTSGPAPTVAGAKATPREPSPPSIPTANAKVDGQPPTPVETQSAVAAAHTSPTTLATSPASVVSTSEANPEAARPTAKPDQIAHEANQVAPTTNSDSRDLMPDSRVDAKSNVIEIRPRAHGDSAPPSMVAPAVQGKSDPLAPVPPLAPREVQLAVVQVADRLHMLAATRAKGGVVIHLQPGHLGTITLTVHTEAGAVRADIAASNDAVRIALEQNRPALAAALHDSRLNLENVTISTQTPTPPWGSGAAPQHQRQSFSHPQPRSAATRSDTPNSPKISVGAVTRPSAAAAGPGVDLWI